MSSNGKSSSRPASMSNIRTYLVNPVSPPKFLVGPTSERPGPILLRHDATAVKLVTRSLPSRDTRNTDRVNIPISVMKYTFTALTTSCSTGLPSMFIFLIFFGWKYELSSLTTVLNIITSLDTFIPPPVLPAQAPTNIRMTSTVLQVCDHWSKSADA